MREGRSCSGRVDTHTTALCATGASVRLPRLWRAPGCPRGIRRPALSDTVAMSRVGMTCSRNGEGEAFGGSVQNARPYRRVYPFVTAKSLRIVLAGKGL